MAEMTLREFEEFVKDLPWREVKWREPGSQMEPHEYVISGWPEVPVDAYWAAVRAIKREGYKGRYTPRYAPDKPQVNFYLAVDGFYYFGVPPKQLCRTRDRQHEPLPEQPNLLENEGGTMSDGHESREQREREWQQWLREPDTQIALALKAVDLATREDAGEDVSEEKEALGRITDQMLEGMAAEAVATLQELERELRALGKLTANDVVIRHHEPVMETGEQFVLYAYGLPPAPPDMIIVKRGDGKMTYLDENGMEGVWHLPPEFN